MTGGLNKFSVGIDGVLSKVRYIFYLTLEGTAERSPYI